jgi:hypothetical protein
MPKNIYYERSRSYTKKQLIIWLLYALRPTKTVTTIPEWQVGRVSCRLLDKALNYGKLKFVLHVLFV